MRTQIITLLDVTQTNARRDGDEKEYSQQSNFNSLCQTAALRANLVPIKVESRFGGIATLGFGNNYKGKHRYWSIIFNDERDTPITQEMFADDFDLIPMTINLDETVEINEGAIYAKDDDKLNIVFRNIDE